MSRWLRAVARHPRWFLLGVLGFTLFSVPGIVDLRSGALRLIVNPSADTLLPSGGPDWQRYERARRQFGSDDAFVVALGAEDVFTPEVLGSVLRMTERLGAIDGVYDVVSLGTALDVQTSEPDTLYLDGEAFLGGDIEVAPFLESVPSGPGELRQLRERALANPIYTGTLYSRDGRTTALLVRLDRISGREVAERGIDREIERIAFEEAGDAEVWISGLPHVETQLRRTVLRELSVILPAVVLLLALVLFLGFGTGRSVVLPLATILVALVWTLGTLGWLGQELNIVTTIIPPLILTIGFSYALHVVSEYYSILHEVPAGSAQQPAEVVEHTLRMVGVPVAVTALTTAAGFLSLGFSRIVAIREFGLFSLLGVGFTVLASLTFTPAVLAVLPLAERSQPEAGSPRLDSLARWLADLALRRRVFLVAGGVVLLVLALVGMTRIRVATEFVNNFAADSEVRRGADAINQRLGGANEIQILVDADLPDAFLEPANLRHIESLQEWLRQQPDVGEAISVVDYVKLLNRALANDPAQYVLPDSRAKITQLFLFGASRETERLVDRRQQFAKVHVRAKAGNSEAVSDLVQRIEARLAEFPSHLHGSVSGSLVLLNRSIDEVARGQWNSLLMAFGAIYVVLAILFTSLRMGLLALFPNFLPIAIYFGALGFTGITLNPWTSLVGCLALGIAVDDTIHYFARFNTDAKRLGDEKQATGSALRALLRPVSLTSLGLCLGLLTLVVSELRSQIEFGVLAAFTLAVAWLIDVTVTPALCAGTRIVTLWDLLALDLGAAPQRSIPLLAGLSTRQARIFALMSSIRSIPAGANLFREGHRGCEMYVILDGKLLSSVEREGSRIELATMARGDTFGEIGLFSDTRTADVDAVTDARVIAFDPEDLERLRRRYPRTAARVLLNLNRLQAERLVRTTRRVR